MTNKTDNNVPREMILAKYGEIALKGLNKSVFEDILVKDITRRLKKHGGFSVRRGQSAVYITPKDGFDLDGAELALLKTFGLGTVQRCLETPGEFDRAAACALPYLKSFLSGKKTFKVEAKRADKSYPLDTPALQRELGGRILEEYPHLSVDVHNPEVTVWIEIRENRAYITARRLKGAGGMPLGSAGTALLLLSGGFDSPVAAYMTAKRGLSVEAVHFQSPPYTSERALMKVRRLCGVLAEYCGEIKLNTVGFTEVQETLRENCPPPLFTVVLRRLMFKAANLICGRGEARAVVTGECVAQVASQTLAAIGCTDAAADYPVFRPLIGFDKIDITELARKIGTFDISAEPYEDCCTVFAPKHPKTRPSLEEVVAAESMADYLPMIQKAADNALVERFF